MPRPCPITDDQGDEIVRLYEGGVSRNDLARRFNASRPFVRDYLDRRGVTVRSLREACCPPLRHDAFVDAAGDERAAYWVGFLMADGCITPGRSIPRRGTVPTITIQLQASDAGHLTTFLRFAGSDLDPYAVKPGKRSGAGARCTVYSDKMVADLARYGVVPRKSATACVTGGLETNRHFWRGVVDGDGSLGRRKRAKPTHRPTPLLQVVGSESLMGQFEVFARAVTGTAARAHRSHGCWAFSLSSGAAADMARRLYSDSSVSLPRKLALAHELLGEWDSRPRRRSITGPRAAG